MIMTMHNWRSTPLCNFNLFDILSIIVLKFCHTSFRLGIIPEGITEIDVFSHFSQSKGMPIDYFNPF